MSSTKIINAIIIAVVVAAVAVGFSYIHLTKPAGQMVHALQGHATSTGDYEYTEGNQYYMVKLEYPGKTHLSGAADVSAREAMEQGLKADLDDFENILQQALTPDEEARLAQDGGQYAFGSEFKEYTSAHYDSFVFLLYEDTGGAHPNAYYRTFVFDQNGTQVELSSLFAQGSDYLSRLAQLATVQVRQQLSERLGSDSIDSIFADGLAPKAENFQNFCIDGDTIHFFFPPYQVAAYAAGTFDIQIPLSSLSDILAPGVR